MKKTLVVGGSGFIGTNFVNFLSFPPKPNKTKELFVSNVLGLNFDEEFSKKIIYKFLMKEYVRHIPEIILHLIKIFFKKFYN